MFDQFVQLQDRIIALLDRAEAILRGPADPDIATLGQTRWESARILREYQLFKQSRIFDPIERSQDYRAPKARRMKAECVRFGEEFHKYVLKWSVVSLLDHWAEYQPAALAEIARIRARLKRERIEVVELLGVKSAAA